MGVDVGSPALHEIPTTFVVSSSGQARKSCEGGHLSHEEGSIYSRGAVCDGEFFLLISVWAISMTSCFVNRAFIFHSQ